MHRRHRIPRCDRPRWTGVSWPASSPVQIQSPTRTVNQTNGRFSPRNIRRDSSTRPDTVVYCGTIFPPTIPKKDNTEKSKGRGGKRAKNKRIKWFSRSAINLGNGPLECSPMMVIFGLVNRPRPRLLINQLINRLFVGNWLDPRRVHFHRPVSWDAA